MTGLRQTGVRRNLAEKIASGKINNESKRWRPRSAAAMTQIFDKRGVYLPNDSLIAAALPPASR